MKLTLHNSFFILIVLLAIITMLTNCSCKFYSKQLSKKCPQQQYFIHDTTFIAQAYADTVFNFNTRDTVIIQNNNFNAKYFRKDSLIYLSGACAPDTIIKKITYYLPSLPQSTIPLWLYVVIIVLCFLALLNFTRR
jgi:hypothetical protein